MKRLRDEPQFHRLCDAGVLSPHTLTCGQAFRWRQCEPGWWRSPLGAATAGVPLPAQARAGSRARVYVLAWRDEQVEFAVEPAADVDVEEERRFLEDYFRLVRWGLPDDAAL